MMKKNILKIVGAVFIVTAVILTQIPPQGLLAKGASGSGFMMDGNKLVAYTGTATSVSVPDGTKVIGAEAFANNAELSYISLPAGLEAIEDGAFSGCLALNRIVVPEGVESIGVGAFADCTALSRASLPASLASVGTSAFAGCDQLSDISIAAGNKYYVCDDGVLYNHDKTAVYQMLAGRQGETYSMPASVEEIKKYAFWGCKNLEEAVLGSHLASIGDYAFSNASGLEYVTIPYSVRSIGVKAFEDCRNLADVTIPVSVTRIDPTAFDGCYDLHITAEEGTVAAEFAASYQNNPSNKIEYEEEPQVNPHRAKELEAEAEKEKSANVSDVSNVEQYVEWDVDSPGVLGRSKVVSRQAVIFMDASGAPVYDGSDPGAASNAGAGNALDEEALQKQAAATVDEGKRIASRAFYKDASLKEFSVPAGVTDIGEFAFARSGLTDVVIPNGVKTIEDGAFYHCDELSSVKLPPSVSKIGPDAFAHTKWLDNWYHGSNVNEFLVVGDGILLAYKGSAAKVSIPYNVRRIAPSVFEGHEEISQVILPDTVKEIGEAAFADCKNLYNISGGGSLEKIADRAFYGCPITTVRIPANVKEVGLQAFGGTGKTDSVVFLGTTLPSVSHEKSAERLSNDKLRAYCFGDIETAVVPAGIGAKEIAGTALDGNALGFGGTVYQLTGSGDSGKATAVFSNLSREQAKPPASIRVYDKAYSVVTTERTDYAKEKKTVSDNSLYGMAVVDHGVLKKDQIALSDAGSTVSLDGYRFYVSDALELSGEALKKQIEDCYGSVNSENSLFMDLSLYDETDNVRISRLGKDTVTMSVQVPPELLDDEICVVTLDENGKPEITFCHYFEKDSHTWVSFELSHFSPYALYGASGELKDKIAQKRSAASHKEGLDASPDTGDHFNVYVILVIGLSALGIFLLLAGFLGGKRKAL